MTKRDLELIKQRFPLSEAVIKRNADAGAGVSNPEQCERPANVGSGDAGKAQSTGCIQVRFILHRVRLLDVDAKYGSVKDLLDCVVHAGFVAGDKEGQVDLKVRQIKVKTHAEERTFIVLPCP